MLNFYEMGFSFFATKNILTDTGIIFNYTIILNRKNREMLHMAYFSYAAIEYLPKIPLSSKTIFKPTSNFYRLIPKKLEWQFLPVSCPELPQCSGKQQLPSSSSLPFSHSLLPSLLQLISSDADYTSNHFYNNQQCFQQTSL